MTCWVGRAGLFGLTPLLPLIAAEAREAGQVLELDQLVSMEADLVLALRAGTSVPFVAYEQEPSHEHAPIGMLQVDLRDDLALGPHYLFRRFYVVPEWRNRGVGHRLLSYALARLEYPGWPVLFTTVGVAPRSYRKLKATLVHQTWQTDLATFRKRLSCHPLREEEKAWAEQRCPSY